MERVDGLEKLPDSDFVTILEITKALLQHVLNQDFVDSVYPADAQDAGQCLQGTTIQNWV